MSKIHLSPEELQLVQNAQLLLTKNIIIEKVYTLFGELAAELQQSSIYSSNNLPAEILSLAPKISRGEKYKGLPYVMLDYPRCFGKEDIFAVRTFFWWGNFFSVTLHLKGKYQQLLVPYLQKHTTLLAENNFQVCITGDEWDHDLSDGNYILLSNSNAISAIDLIGKPFYKLTSRVELHQWNEMNERLLGLQRVIANAIAG